MASQVIMCGLVIKDHIPVLDAMGPSDQLVSKKRSKQQKFPKGKYTQCIFTYHYAGSKFAKHRENRLGKYILSAK